MYGEGASRVRALDHVSFTIHRGEFTLVVGSSGSGKSTLLNMMGLLDSPTSGRVIVDGVDTSLLKSSAMSKFRNMKLGFVFQFSNLLMDLSVIENVMLPRQIGGMSTTKKIRRDAKDLLESVGLNQSGILDRYADRISGGQAQRVAIARGLMNRPSIVLADEPTGNLDSASSKGVIKLMKSLARAMGQTFVVVTHDKAHFGDVDRVITVEDGRVCDDDIHKRGVCT